MLIFLHFQFLIIQMTKEVNRILLIDLNTHFYHFYNFKSLYFLYFFNTTFFDSTLNTRFCVENYVQFLKF